MTNEDPERAIHRTVHSSPIDPIDQDREGLCAYHRGWYDALNTLLDPAYVTRRAERVRDALMEDTSP